LGTAAEIGLRTKDAFIARAAALAGIAAEGAIYAFALGALGILCVLLGFRWTGLAIIALALATGAFFRDPERFPSAVGNVVLSGADGKVIDIAEEEELAAAVTEHDGPYRRVSVFMSLLDVHVNRAPVEGEVLAVKHTPGRFRAAFRDDAGLYNERNLMVFTDSAARSHAMVQVAGYLARRIVCRVRPHDRIQRGQRVGLIMFGSRVDHFMPLKYRVTVRVGDRVRAGESVIAEVSG
jgi:phosphatidylserine decarboxylase